jgi:muramoyltetrapeptide carboxypeptidase LdcA involved in peptidoglycan recycling
MQQTIKPPRLRPGDTVGTVSPSWGGAGTFPHRVEAGLRQLEAMGFRTKVGAHALNRIGYVSDTPENRAADLHDMFRDPEVRAIVAAIGGDHSCQLLPLLDLDLIRANPKIFMGYSDNTVLNVAFWKGAGLRTFNGPALITDFAEQPRMYEYTERCMLKVLCEAQPAGLVEPSPWWTEEFQNWEEKLDLERPRTQLPSPGWTWLKPGKAEGTLVGGCVESLQHLRGTHFWPGLDDWQGAIFFWETSEDKPSPAVVDGILMDYENMGVLERLGGMIVGRPMYYTGEEKAQLNDIILERTRKYDFPVVTGMDFGHTAPQFTLPVGCRALIDGEGRRFEIVEAAVE